MTAYISPNAVRAVAALYGRPSGLATQSEMVDELEVALEVHLKDLIQQFTPDVYTSHPVIPIVMAKAGKALKSHMKSRMRSFTKGTMHSTKTRTGPVVRSRKQAIAIALSEARSKGLKGAPRRKR